MNTSHTPFTLDDAAWLLATWVADDEHKGLESLARALNALAVRFDCPKCGETATFRDAMGRLWDSNAHWWREAGWETEITPWRLDPTDD